MTYNLKKMDGVINLLNLGVNIFLAKLKIWVQKKYSRTMVNKSYTLQSSPLLVIFFLMLNLPRK